MYKAGYHGAFLSAGTKQTVQLILKKVTTHLKPIDKLTFYPFVCFRSFFSCPGRKTTLFSKTSVSTDRHLCHNELIFP